MPNTQYPTKPIQILVPGVKGGPSDDIARLLAEKLPLSLGQKVSVENLVPLNDCYELAAKAPADGHTLLMGGATFFINAALYRNLPFDSRTAFAPVSLAASIVNVLVVNPSIPARSFDEFLAHLKANPGVLKYGSSSFASPPHLAGELFRQMAGVDIVHVPFEGHLAAGHALVEGRDIQFMFDAILSAKSHIDAGEVIPLAVTSLKRAPVIGEIPTLSECGLTGYDINPDMGVLVPAATPQDVVTTLSSAIRKIMHSSEVRTRLENVGMEALGTTPEGYRGHMRSSFTKWATVMKNAGIEPRDLTA